MTKFIIGDRVHVKGSTKAPALYEITELSSYPTRNSSACKVAEVACDGTLYAPQPFDIDLLVLAPAELQNWRGTKLRDRLAGYY